MTTETNSMIIKNEFVLAFSNSLGYAILVNQKFLFYVDIGKQSFNILGALSKSGSKSNVSKEIGKTYSKVALFNKIGNFKESIKLSKSSIKAQFTVK